MVVRLLDRPLVPDSTGPSGCAVRILDGPRPCVRVVSMLCAMSSPRPLRTRRVREATPRRRARLRARQAGCAGPSLRGRDAAHRGRARRGGRGLAHPVREALLRLEVEGLIRLYPKKGALVLPVSAQEIADVVETRQLVEEHAVAQGRTGLRRADRAPRGTPRASRRSRPPPAIWPPPPSPTAASTPRSSAAAATRSSPASTTSCATGS